MTLSPLPASTANRLEAALNKVRFMEVPVGSVLGQVWHAVLCAQPIGLSIPSRLRDIGVGLSRRFPRTARDSTTGLEPGRILSTWINIGPHCRDLVIPLVEMLGAGQCHIMGRDEEMQLHLPKGCGYFSWWELPAVPRGVWWKEYQGIRAAVRERALETLAESTAYHVLWPRLENALLPQLHRIATYQQLLKRLRPRLVITEWDRHPRICPLIGAAKAQGIPTLTQVHGVINNEFGYTPVLADTALCWGKQQWEQFVDLGTPPERLAVTGYPRLTPAPGANSGEVRRKAGFDADKPLVLLASNPLSPELRLSFAQQYCEAMEPLTRLQAAIRIHPSERLDLYAGLRRRFPTIRFMANDEWTLDEALAASDLVVCYDSGLANDALVKGRLVVVFDVLPLPLGNGQVLIDHAGCPRAASPQELRSLVERILNDTEVSALLRERANAYVGYFCAAFGAEATRNAANLVLERAGPSGGWPNPDP